MNDTLTSNTQSLSSYRLASSLILSLFEELGFTSENQIDEDELKIKISDILRSTIEKNATVSSKREPFPIIINGSKVMVDADTLSYSEVIGLTVKPYSPYYTMVHNEKGTGHGMTLHEGGPSVKISKNSIFEFIHTGNA
jgi:hypothetical protein